MCVLVRRTESVGRIEKLEWMGLLWRHDRASIVVVVSSMLWIVVKEILQVSRILLLLQYYYMLKGRIGTVLKKIKMCKQNHIKRHLSSMNKTLLEKQRKSFTCDLQRNNFIYSSSFISNTPSTGVVFVLVVVVCVRVCISGCFQYYYC